MDIILIRHAQPAYTDAEGKARNNPPLTDLGHVQADYLRPIAAEWTGKNTHLLVSPMVRARQTAAPIAEVFGYEATVHDWMQEIGLPAQWDGTPATAVDNHFRDAQTRHPDDWWDGLDGGESFRAFHDRVWSGFETTLNELGVLRSDHHPTLWDIANDDLRLVMVAHGGTNGLLLAMLLGTEAVPWEWERFFIGHASVSRLTTTRIGPDQIFSLRAFADTSHISGGQVTA